MKKAWFYILLSLANEARHGSGIMRDVLMLTHGELTLWPATLYGSLDELRENGWITEAGDASRPSNESERKRYYAITPSGRDALSAEVKRVEGMARVARGRLAEEAR